MLAAKSTEDYWINEKACCTQQGGWITHYNLRTVSTCKCTAIYSKC